MIGVIPDAMVSREVANPGLHQVRIVATMHERKAQFTELSDGFLTLPAGSGRWTNCGKRSVGRSSAITTSRWGC